MPKTAKHLLVITLALLVLTIALCWRNWRSNAGDGALVRWGSGDFTISEEAYYADRIDEIISAWIKMGQRAEYAQEGRPRQPYDTFLVLDFGHHELWIEERGQVLQEYHGELPARMTWAVHYDDGNGVKLLGSLVRLKYWGFDLSRRFPETAWLAGQRGKGYLAFDLAGRSAGISRSRDGGPFKPSYRPTPQKPGVRYYDSILVSDADYEQARLSWTETSKQTAPGRRLLISSIEENKAAWANIRKKLYQAIEGQVNRAGFNLSGLQVQPGPDYSAAHAEMQVDTTRIHALLRRGGWSVGVFLLIDYLGSDVWYAKIAPDPRIPAPSRFGVNPVEELPLEFLVSAGRTIRSSARREWIEKGRARQKVSTDSRSKWTAVLPNGVAVTFLGVCTHPSEGRQWWGPDGSPLDYILYAPARSLLLPDNRGVRSPRLFEIAWQLQFPRGGLQSVGFRSHLEGTSSLSSVFCQDRYGVFLHDGHHETCSFGWSQKTLTVEAEVNKQGFCTVNFKNISFTPGQNQGFEIEVVK